MSSISNAHLGRRHESPSPHHQIYENPYHDHSYGFGAKDPYHDYGYGSMSTPQHYMVFPRDQTPILDSINREIDCHETSESHVYTVHLPGLRRNDVRMEVDNDAKVVSIICEKSVEKQEQRGGWHLVETSSGHYVQRIGLPENSNVELVKGSLERGVLTIVVPKLTRAINRNVRTINISEH